MVGTKRIISKEILGFQDIASYLLLTMRNRDIFSFELFDVVQNNCYYDILSKVLKEVRFDKKIVEAVLIANRNKV